MATGVVLALGLTACVSATEELPTFEPTLAPSQAEVTALSNQDGAVQDLRGCLARTPVLNVFYLLDDSGSLKDTDPDRLRVGVLADSLASLANLAPQVQVNWASGTFKSEFTSLTEWKPLASVQDAEVLRSEIPADSPGWTNWEAAILGARDSLATQSTVSPGCSLLIWFTDGAILLGSGDAGAVATDNAFERLCLGEEGSPGIMQGLRTDQVVVFGVLLSAPSETGDGGGQASRRLTRLVEATPDEVDAVSEGPCGVPSSVDVRGTVEVVTAAGDLAKVFDRLPALLSGGAVGEVDPATGEFLVPAGVSRFALQFGPRPVPWVLRAPNGTIITPGDVEATAGLTISESGTTAKPTVDVAIGSADMEGIWTIDGHLPGQDLLYRFSDLEVDLDERRGANFGVVSGEESTVTGVVRDRDGAPANLDLYTFDWRIQELLPGEPLPLDLPNDTTDNGQAQFAVDLGATNAEAGSQMTAVITLSDLRTVEGDVPLAGPTVSLPLRVLRPEQVPRNIEIVFDSPAEAAASPAGGAFFAEAAEDGKAVKIQVPENALGPVDDRFDRMFELGEADPECEAGVIVCGEFSGDQAKVPFTLGIVQGEKPQYATSTGEVLVELLVAADPDNSDAPPVRILRTLPFTLETERPINLGLLVSLLIGLFLLGLAIPVGLAWALKRVLVWIQHGRFLQRAELGVTITGGSVSLTAADLADEATLVESFRNMPPRERVRSHADGRMGPLVIRVPLQPLAAAWFALTPPLGTCVIADHTGQAPRRFSAAVDAGRLVATNGVLPGAWAVAFHERDILGHLPGAPLSGVLVVYMRPVQGVSGQYVQRLREIFTTTDWQARVNALVESVNLGSAANEAAGAKRDAPGGGPSRAAPGGLPAESAEASSERRPPGRPRFVEGPALPASNQSPTQSRPPRSEPDVTPPSQARPPGR
jgi:hypothetical protein